MSWSLHIVKDTLTSVTLQFTLWYFIESYPCDYPLTDSQIIHLLIYIRPTHGTHSYTNPPIFPCHTHDTCLGSCHCVMNSCHGRYAHDTWHDNTCRPWPKTDDFIYDRHRNQKKNVSWCAILLFDIWYIYHQTTFVWYMIYISSKPTHEDVERHPWEEEHRKTPMRTTTLQTQMI
jgi:hypothetical protein